MKIHKIIICRDSEQQRFWRSPSQGHSEKFHDSFVYVKKSRSHFGVSQIDLTLDLIMANFPNMVDVNQHDINFYLTNKRDHTYDCSLEIEQIVNSDEVKITLELEVITPYEVLHPKQVIRIKQEKNKKLVKWIKTNNNKIEWRE